MPLSYNWYVRSPEERKETVRFRMEVPGTQKIEEAVGPKGTAARVTIPSVSTMLG